MQWQGCKENRIALHNAIGPISKLIQAGSVGEECDPVKVVTHGAGRELIRDFSRGQYRQPEPEREGS